MSLSDTQIRFQQLLRDLFQFDCADLDFGIYRIMNHKRDVIERFITKDMPRWVEEELHKDSLAAQARAADELEVARTRVLDAIGEDALDPNGTLVEKYRETKAGREYLTAQARAQSARVSEALEVQVYNHLHTFFSRYWQEGDFVSKRRYSKKERYAIPYNGEEVYLYWANHDQYYTKTGEYFTDYTWIGSAGVTVHFKLKAADLEQNNVKGEERFFLPRMDEISWDNKARTITFLFDYRPLTDQETIKYGRKNQQESIISELLREIASRLSLKTATVGLAALTAEKYKTVNGEPVSHLEYHLRQYTRRNTSDFFIHKDLKGFLTRELDFYLKNEVLNLEAMERAGENLAPGWFQLLNAIKSVGQRIIEFLAQVEEFQRMLWEMRKFITETFYCITLNSIPEEFYPEIAACDAQWDEWNTLYGIHEFPRELATGDTVTPEGRLAFLRAHQTLMLDTRHFAAGFTDRLLARFENLDQLVDGLLVHSENWQALNLLKGKYCGRVKCAYIDPPYNTAATPILYKNDYKDSSWISLMTDRCRLARYFLDDSGIIAAAIDDEEVLGFRFVLSSLFERELGIAVVRSNPAGRKTKGQLAPAHEYLLLYGNRDAIPDFLDITEERLRRFPLQDENGHYSWANLIRSGSGDRREDRPTLYYPIFATQDGYIRIPEMRWIKEKGSYELLEEPLPGEQVVYPIVERGGVLVHKRWQRGHERVRGELENYRVRRQEDGSLSIDFKTYMDEESLPTTWWDKKEYASSNYGALELKALFGEKVFDYSKATALVRDSILVSGGRRQDCTVVDFFAGSGTTGHAVINLNREDGGQRKFVLVEMADYFDTVLLPRIKKVTFTPDWKEGKPRRLATAEESKRSPRIIKVVRLESYEDALNNISLEAAGRQQAMKFDDYLLQYMLRWESRQSETLLNAEKLNSPFDYVLHIHRDGETRTQRVDLPETFIYLIGLDVERRMTVLDEDRRYLLYRGVTRDGKRVSVVWRDTQGWEQADYERDRDFVISNRLADDSDIVFVNGDSMVPGAQSLDGVFKQRMFASVEE